MEDDNFDGEIIKKLLSDCGRRDMAAIKKRKLKKKN